MLEDAGYEAHVAATVEAALVALEVTQYTTIISAVELEKGGGFAFLDKVLSDERYRHLPVIVLSKSTDEEQMASAIGRGAIDFLVKPINSILFLARVRASVERTRMNDRERDYLRLVDLERRRAELLLYDLLPAEIADRLKRGDTLIADAHEEVTVLFADLVGFTTYADGRPPHQVVRSLDNLFSRFDELASSYGVEKIKTLGDGYMAASGLPAARADHSIAAADLALAMREVVRAYVTESGHRFELRIGLATGPVVAGVIGARRHVYDLWGDTVNIASRMETTAPTDAIQITDITASKLQNVFHLQPLGVVEIKGKKPMETNLLLGRSRGERVAKRAALARTASFDARRALELAERATTEMELIDPASQLLSPRGFLPLAEAIWRSGAREKRAVLVLRVTLVAPSNAEGMRQIVGGLRATFRDTDLLVRWGTTTYAMVGLERSLTNPDVLQVRLRERLNLMASSQPLEIQCSVLRLVPSVGENEHRLIHVLDGADDTSEAIA